MYMLLYAAFTTSAVHQYDRCSIYLCNSSSLPRSVGFPSRTISRNIIGKILLQQLLLLSSVVKLISSRQILVQQYVCVCGCVGVRTAYKL